MCAKVLPKEQYVKGISIINPDEVERNYLLFCIDYAIKCGYNHIQITGPIHDPVKGNIDGMTFNRKYAQFNNEKNAEYVNLCMSAVNEGLEKSSKAGIKTFMWHHELDLPNGFKEAFPETLNENGDIEVTHPIVKDYLENKILDFFNAYPKMDGIVLTLHETKIPLLKLKNQKLDKVERVKYVTKILYDTCASLGKEMILRPFASQAQDQTDMVKAFSEVSKDIIIMDKWTKYDWSLSLPDNDFFSEITENPFVVETDIFGEYFGKGRLPIMLKQHIEHKYNHCQKYPNSGFVNRIDRNYQNPFGTVNEVNLIVMSSILNGLDVDEQVDKFFFEKFGEAGKEVRKIMEATEENQRKIFYLDNYYFTQGSYFPDVNHCKNHFFFEIMKENCDIASNEWFIPVGWKRGSIEKILTEKDEAVSEAENILERVIALENKIDKEEYAKLYLKFKNLYYVAHLWRELTLSLYNMTKYFELKDKTYLKELKGHMKNIDIINAEGKNEFAEDFYNFLGCRGFTHDIPEFGGDFVKSLKTNLKAELKAQKLIDKQKDLTDYIICGGCVEGHKLQKEVNFSDTMLVNGDIVRIPGNRRGAMWSQINAHGWFSYELKVKPNSNNTISIMLGSATDKLSIKITVGDDVYQIKEAIKGKKEFSFNYKANEADAVRIRIDRIDGNTPFVYTITSK